MRFSTSLALAGLAVALQGCATTPGNDRLLSREGESRVVQPTVFPLSLSDIQRLTRDGKSPSDIIVELDRTSTVLDIKPSEVAGLLAAGVHPDVLDWIHQRQLDAIGDTWKGRVAQQQQDHVNDLRRLRNEMELRALSRYPFGYPHPFYRYGPGIRFGF
ncbi:MAG: hypothetical protein RIS59_250 [Pseudomonadota bacterium]|jgi:hypothetical protein